MKWLGGGLGAKGTPPTHIAAAAAIAATTINKPVRVQLDLEANMTMIGMRMPYFMKYEVNNI